MYQYSSHQLFIKSNRVSLPLKNIRTERNLDNSTIETIYHRQQPVSKVSTKCIMPQPHPKLYGSTTKQSSKDITTFCIYKPKSQYT